MFWVHCGAMKHDYAEVFSENVKFLIDMLGEPEEGELNYTGGRRALSRLEALRELKRLEDEGIITPP
ncbi:MAG: hypothetical protein QXR62_05085, partial [Candidatus Bathyarchaeia archaeon]